MEYFSILLPLALILIATKTFAIISHRLGLPQVVGMLIAGILLGLIRLIPGQTIFTTDTMEGLSFLAKIGVVLLMFSAGIGTDLKQFKQTGFPSVIITVLGVVFPVGLGFIVACAFNGGFTNLTQHMVISNLFYGAILAATSVSITVAALKELGKLNTKVGSSIITAAILDDIIGVVLLSLFISLSKTGTAGEIGIVIGKLIGFFAATAVLGIIIRFALKYITKKYTHMRRIPIFSFALCFFLAYAAEKWFGVADITGAYVAGLMISGLSESNYIDKKIEISNYMVFSPVFFANIGIQADFGAIDPAFIGFGFAFVAVGIVGKLLGCGLGALICRYSLKDSFRVGVGMMVRAEVVLVCAQKGLDSGLVDQAIMPFVLILIIITTLITPILLKLSYRKDNDLPPMDNSLPMPEDSLNALENN